MCLQFKVQKTQIEFILVPRNYKTKTETVVSHFNKLQPNDNSNFERLYY